MQLMCVSGSQSLLAYFLLSHSIGSWKLEPFDESQSAYALICMGHVPPRVEAFCFLAVRGKILMADNLRRGMSLDSISDMWSPCGRETESIGHLFIRCHVASSLWGFFLKESGVACVISCFPRSHVCGAY